MATDSFKTSPHTPAHWFRAGAYYLITGSTYNHAPYLAAEDRRRAWHSAFAFAAEHYGWTVKAWVVLPNHYHAMVQAPDAGAENLPAFAASYHKFTARRWNADDQQPGRQVWWNYWDTCLRSEADYLARWNYVHWNPVKHKLVDRPEDYPFSSYREWMAAAPDTVRWLEREYPFDGVRDVPDDF